MADGDGIDWDLVDVRLSIGTGPEGKSRRDKLFARLDPNGNGQLSLTEVQVGLGSLLEAESSSNRKYDEVAHGLIPGMTDFKPAIKVAFNVARHLSKGSNEDHTIVDRRQFHALLLYFRHYLELLVLFKKLDDSGDMTLSVDEILPSIARLAKWSITKEQVQSKLRAEGGQISFTHFAEWCVSGTLEDFAFDEHEGERSHGSSPSGSPASRRMSAGYGRIDWAEVDRRIPTASDLEGALARDAIFKKIDGNGSGQLSMVAVQACVASLLEGDHSQRKKGEVAQSIIPGIRDTRPAGKCAFQAASSLAEPIGATKKKSKKRQAADESVDRREFHALLVYLRYYLELQIIFQDVDTSEDLRVDKEECYKALPLLADWGIDKAAVDTKFSESKGGELKFPNFADWCLRIKLQGQKFDELEGDQPEGEPEQSNLDLTVDMSIDVGAGAVDDVANQLVSKSLVKKGPSEEEVAALLSKASGVQDVLQTIKNMLEEDTPLSDKLGKQLDLHLQALADVRDVGEFLEKAINTLECLRQLQTPMDDNDDLNMLKEDFNERLEEIEPISKWKRGMDNLSNGIAELQPDYDNVSLAIREAEEAEAMRQAAEEAKMRATNESFFTNATRPETGETSMAPGSPSMSTSAPFMSNTGPEIMSNTGPATMGATAPEDDWRDFGATLPPEREFRATLPPDRTTNKARSMPRKVLSQSLPSLPMESQGVLKRPPHLTKLSHVRTMWKGRFGEKRPSSFFLVNTNPSPGSYNLVEPSRTGKFRESSGFSFGGGSSRFGYDPHPGKAQPAPGQYGIVKDPAQVSRKVAFSLGPRKLPHIVRSVDPGPGAYEVKSSLSGGRACKSRGRIVNSYRKEDALPGPGQYNPCGPGVGCLTNERNAQMVGFGTSCRTNFSEEFCRRSPGPGTYDVDNPRTQIGTGAKKFSLKGRPTAASSFASYVTPGPGTYDGEGTCFGY